ncbi:MAG: hypothetical protein M1828_004500 [Chrysothrix sp. TS-e1954]|nr:MAG: hypothetical protein M1828_004500 [Chrysothrix sp. TS-e1954]
MAYKRPRAEFEADLRAQQSPYVFYGTPLPPLDPDVRDDGSYVPVWKQEVTDERGRKRLHGAFTGGYSAGYFNTVGSKEGWTPATFVSSRSKRRKDEPSAAKPEDFMDEEDLAEAAEKQTLQTQEGFAGIGSTSQDGMYKGSIMDILRPQEDTMGVKLLRRMGWREGQGVGPKVKRSQGTELEAPANSPMIRFHRKDDRKGLGYESEARLDGALSHAPQPDSNEHQDIDKVAPKPPQRRGGFGVGVLNDDGSDNDDAYSMGPRISYNRKIGDSKKTKKLDSKPKPQNAPANPLLKSKPVFLSKKHLQNRPTLRKCHDGRFPLDGFVLSAATTASAALTGLDENHANPTAPKDWNPTSTTPTTITNQPYKSTADAAKASTLDPKARASLLGEAQLPGKSVFDFLTPAARNRLASTSGNASLPIARSEAGPPPPPAPAPRSTQPNPPPLPTAIHVPPAIALAALGRGTSGWVPYADDEPKRARYQHFLKHHAGVIHTIGAPQRPTSTTPDDWAREQAEFAHAAHVFKPMSGSMASRFTSASADPDPDSAKALRAEDGDDTTAARDATTSRTTTTAKQKPQDPAEAAAEMGMFGPMTRSVQTFYPSRLLCKRFNVKAPAHVEADSQTAASGSTTAGERPMDGGRPMQFTTGKTMAPKEEARAPAALAIEGPGKGDGMVDEEGPARQGEGHSYVDVEKNDALEGRKAGDAVFKAIFGSEDEDDE